jgi:3D (Asp-Asp-Asp) domain-containing protein
MRRIDPTSFAQRLRLSHRACGRIALAMIAVLALGTSCTALRQRVFAPSRAVASVPRPAAEAKTPMPFTATAYALEGLTASGTRARKGIVAADPRVLPLGSKIRVSGAGAYSGDYLVEDTGALIKGHIIDIKVATVKEARQFGRRRIGVEVLR